MPPEYSITASILVGKQTEDVFGTHVKTETAFVETEYVIID